jgi:hypothetical protein
MGSSPLHGSAVAGVGLIKGFYEIPDRKNQKPLSG